MIEIDTNGMDPEYIAAKTKLLIAQTLGQDTDNEMSGYLAETARLATERERQKFEWEMAGPGHHRIYYLTGGISDASSAKLIDVMTRWENLDRESNDDRMYTIVLCSPGGEVVSGFQLYSYLKGLSERRKLRISAAGLCASMATVIHQAATPGLRLIEPGCSYLLHKVSGGVGGRFDSIADTTAWMEQLNRTMTEIFAEHSQYTADEIDEMIDRREKFLTVSEVVEWGLADEIGYVG